MKRVSRDFGRDMDLGNRCSFFFFFCELCTGKSCQRYSGMEEENQASCLGELFVDSMYCFMARESIFGILY